MNKVIITGKINSIDYKLVDKGKNFAIAIIKLKVENKGIINVLFKNDLADKVFANFKIKDKILIYGFLKEIKKNLIVVAEELAIYNFNKKGKLNNGKMD